MPQGIAGNQWDETHCGIASHLAGNRHLRGRGTDWRPRLAPNDQGRVAGAVKAEMESRPKTPEREPEEQMISAALSKPSFIFCALRINGTWLCPIKRL